MKPKFKTKTRPITAELKLKGFEEITRISLKGRILTVLTTPSSSGSSENVKLSIDLARVKDIEVGINRPWMRDEIIITPEQEG
ncbi:MAG: hypothetical protein KAS32_16640 [Candidatus Peribacteraceae bacterium]|nr:hypothetical protein [Candidatus Peribacteraceae bacterium]